MGLTIKKGQIEVIVKNKGQKSETELIRERIVETARERFLASGFSKVTMDELVDNLGISKKTMYTYFSSKDELMSAVIDLHITRLKEMLSEIFESSAHFIDKLYDLWSTLGHIASQISKQFQDDIRKFRPDLWKRIETMRREMILANFSRLVDEGIRLGHIRSDVNREVVVLMYLAAIQGVVNPTTLAEYSFSAHDALKTILGVFLEGILTDSARKRFRRRISLQSHTRPK